MPLRYRLEYNVTGTGFFPFEGLRYDRSSPATDEDAAKFVSDVRDLEEFTTPRTVKLVMFVETQQKTPTIGNWRSHQWPVDPNSLVYTKV